VAYEMVELNLLQEENDLYKTPHKSSSVKMLVLSHQQLIGKFK